MVVIALLHILVACWLSLYGFNALCLTLLALRRRRPEAALRLPHDHELPRVTVQLPLYNEKYVAARLIDAICALDYPRAALQIQVLDDSTDETARLVAQRVALWQQRGLDIEAVRRPTRRGYKAGALSHALASATGDFIALFDADFVPPPDWLRRTVAHFYRPDSADVGLVQTRWGHLNRDYSPLTQAQALALDGHFGIEQEARARGGLLLNFNGTAGLWRRQCIEAAGGWSSATLCEDLDLSYRAQLLGWRIRYDSAIVAPAEIPAQVAAFKRQQFRWAKGSLQVARQMVGRLVIAPLSLWQKLQALLHLTGYLLHPLLLLQLLLLVPLLLVGWPAAVQGSRGILGVLTLAGLGAPLLYSAAQARLAGRRAVGTLRWLPLLVLLGTGVAISNSRAVIEGLFGAGGNDFQRTPKFGLDGGQGRPHGSPYLLGWNPVALAELGAALGSMGMVLVALEQGQRAVIPFLLLYAAAFAYVGGSTLWEQWGQRRHRAAPVGA